MPAEPLTSAQVSDLLAAAPPRIAALTADLLPAQLRAAPAPDAWSVDDVLAHLRACADIWGACIATLLAADRPTLRAINPTTWIDGTDYPALAFRPSFHAYTAQRTALLAVLTPLPPAAWARAATVTGAGKPLERTVHFYAQWLAKHERTHFRQLARTVQVVSR